MGRIDCLECDKENPDKEWTKIKELKTFIKWVMPLIHHGITYLFPYDCDLKEKMKAKIKPYEDWIYGT